jgi:hypothetical protein
MVTDNHSLPVLGKERENMRTLRWVFALSFAGVMCAGTARAQTTLTSGVQQPGSIRQMAFQSDDYGYAVTDSGLAAPASPSNAPPAPPAATGGTAAKPEAEAPKEAAPAAADETPPPETPYRIFHNICDFGQWEDCHHLELRGFIDVGYSANPEWPQNKYNGPVAYNDRANEAQLNQLYFTAERLTKVENDCGIDYGYRMDVLYGTDNRFVEVLPGSQWDSGWNNGNFIYGMAMPQLYGQVQINKLTLEGGHFYAPCGYEVANADGNFFYSHSLEFLYAMPTTLTGGYATYKVKDKLLVNGGFDTGWNELSEINGKTNYFLGFDWTSPDKDGKVEVLEEVFLGNTQPNNNTSFRYLFDTTVKVKLGDKWVYGADINFAHDSDTSLQAGGSGPASWSGIANYLIYTINDCWSFGARYELFDDLDGAVTSEFFTNNPIPTSTLCPASRWQNVTLGLNWKPNLNVTCRTEARWDWAENTAAPGVKPFAVGRAARGKTPASTADSLS